MKSEQDKQTFEYSPSSFPWEDWRKYSTQAVEAVREARGRLNHLLMVETANKDDTTDTKRWMETLERLAREIERTHS